MQPLIRLEGVDVAIDGKVILRDLRWCLREGEHWAVLGGNGSGKSTFLKLIRGELAPAPGCTGRRVYGFDGDEQVTAVGIKEKIALISPELQTRYLTQEWSRTALQVIHSGFSGGDYAYQRLSEEQKNRVLAIVRLLGILELLPRNVQELSTGELRKILIARALAGAPRVLICDEVCDGLDAVSRENLLSALNRVARSGTQLLLTTHRAEELIPAITQRLLFKGGRIVESGVLPLASSGSKAADGGALPAIPKKRRTVVAGQLHDAKVLIQIERADVYLNEHRVLHGINLEIKSGEHWAVLGPNGAGKSTLLKLILGDVHPALGGRVRRFEFTPKNTIWELKRRIGFVSPELQSNYRDDVTGLEAIASGFFSSIGLMLKPSCRQVAEAATLARKLGLGELVGKSVLQMSYGEFRRILLARALVQRPQLLICDEPFDGLDVSGRQQMADTLEAVARSGTNLVLVTHHARDLPGCLTHVIELECGRAVFQGAAARHAAQRRREKVSWRADLLPAP